ncbi:MAG: Bug family tripartite tricarboxylate transporter substrate binding protein [Syntrophales bacterium]
MRFSRNRRTMVIPAMVIMSLVAMYSLSLVPAEAADTFPTKPITILNSSPAGSPADVMARQIAQNAKKHLSQPMVVVNKPGGSGGVMFASLMADPTDGYTIAAITSALITALHGDLKKDFSLDQFEFLAHVQKEPFCIVVRSDSPFKTLKEMIDHAKKNPRIKMGGQATYSALHLLALALAEESGMPMSYVPYRGGSEIITNLLGGHIPVTVSSPTTMNQYVASGKVRALAASGEKRLPQWKDVPTLKELGYDIVITQYRGFAAKKGLPADVRATLVETIRKAMEEPGFKEYLAKNSQVAEFMGPEGFTAAVRKDYEYMGKLLQRVVKK